MDELHKPLVAASKIVAAGSRIVMQSASRGSFVEVLGTNRRKTNLQAKRSVCAPIVGSSGKLPKRGWHPWTSCAQRTGRVTP